MSHLLYSVPLVVFLMIALFVAYSTRFVYKTFMPFFGFSFKKAVILSALGCIALLLLCMFAGGMIMAITVHMLMVFVICDIFLQLFKIPSLKKYSPEKFRHFNVFFTGGIFALALVISIFGSINASNIQTTRYSVSFDGKTYESTKIMFVSDLHIKESNSKNILNSIERVYKKEKPHIVIVGGDLADSSTDTGSLEKSAAVFSRFAKDVPVLFVNGNHDIMGNRNFDTKEINSVLSKSGVIVLCDGVFEHRGITYIGRNETFADSRGFRRAAISDFGLDFQNKPAVVIDHQPKDLEQLGECGVDMSLSGHTHNGQIFPVGYLCSVLGINELQYGKKVFGTNTAIVSSGVGTWGMNVRTMGKSEIVIIDVK